MLYNLWKGEVFWFPFFIRGPNMVSSKVMAVTAKVMAVTANNRSSTKEVY